MSAPLTSTGALDPRKDKHEFEPMRINPFFCSYCSAPKPQHNECGHAITVIGCQTCSDAIFSKRRADRRRRRNLEAIAGSGFEKSDWQS
jgi:hypothetical protein